MKILVTGINGQLGHDVSLTLKRRGMEVVAPTHSEMDITDRKAVDSYFSASHPDAVIHCAAYTAVDKAEDEPELCRKVNVNGTRNIVENCIKLDIPVMYISTDYVFNGTGSKPWEPSDKTDPINIYGVSKRDGENEVLKSKKFFIVRISWVFGINGNNFIKTMRRLSETKKCVNVVDDQYGSPTYTKDLAELITEMITTDKYGIYHAHNEGICTWADLAEETIKISNADTKINHISSDMYPMKAKRPMNSRMSTDKLLENGFCLLPHWEDALLRYMADDGSK